MENPMQPIFDKGKELVDTMDACGMAEGFFRIMSEDGRLYAVRVEKLETSVVDQPLPMDE